MNVFALSRWLFLSFFLSFLLVVGVPQHENQKYEGNEKVGGIDGYKGYSFMEGLRTYSGETTGFGEILK